MSSQAAGCLVWVVGGSPVEAEHACSVLRPECRVESFSDGTAALARLATGITPDVWVLDRELPGMSALDLCRYLRDPEREHANAGILLLTASQRTDDIVEGLAAGASDYVAKPYAGAELRARVGALLRARSLLARAERAEELGANLLKLAPAAVIAIDDTYRIAIANEAARDVLKHRAETLVGALLADLLPELAPQLERPVAAETVALADIRLGERVFSPTLRGLSADSALRAIIALRDMTEARHLAARRLDFYSIIAHDLRAPLTALMLRTQLMLDGQHGPVSDLHALDLKKMDGNLHSLVEMINDFLDIARFDNAGYRLTKNEVDLHALVNATMKELGPMLDKGGLHWVHHASERVSVVGDAQRLRQVMANLITNAVKFTATGGTVTTTISNRVHEVEVAVTDTGVGISADVLPTIFERYTRASRSGRQVSGTGLGLMIVREIVEAHGGIVGAESTVGVGSHFWFRLPRVANNHELA